MKKAFYALKWHLEEAPRRLSRVALGASFEAWLIAEACVALDGAPGSGVDGKNEWVENESRKRDLVFRHRDAGITHTVELKLLYPWSNGKLESEKLEVLRDQLTRDPYEDETRATRRLAWIAAVWTNDYNPESADEFFERAADLTRRYFVEAEYTTQHDYVFERVKGLTSIDFPFGPSRAEVGLCALARR